MTDREDKWPLWKSWLLMLVLGAASWALAIVLVILAIWLF